MLAHVVCSLLLVAARVDAVVLIACNRRPAAAPVQKAAVAASHKQPGVELARVAADCVVADWRALVVPTFATWW